ETNVKWFATLNDALALTNELPRSTKLINNATYYGVSVVNSNCGSEPIEVTITLDLGTEELDLASLEYYPNPIDNEFNISYIEDIKRVEVFTVTGQKVYSKEYASKVVKIDLSSLSSGTYMIRLETDKAAQ